MLPWENDSALVSSEGVSRCRDLCWSVQPASQHFPFLALIFVIVLARLMLARRRKAKGSVIKSVPAWSKQLVRSRVLTANTQKGLCCYSIEMPHTVSGWMLIVVQGDSSPLSPTLKSCYTVFSRTEKQHRWGIKYAVFRLCVQLKETWFKINHSLQSAADHPLVCAQSFNS